MRISKFFGGCQGRDVEEMSPALVAHAVNR